MNRLCAQSMCECVAFAAVPVLALLRVLALPLAALGAPVRAIPSVAAAAATKTVRRILAPFIAPPPLVTMKALRTGGPGWPVHRVAYGHLVRTLGALHADHQKLSLRHRVATLCDRLSWKKSGTKADMTQAPIVV